MRYATQLIDLGRTVDFKNFWQIFLKEKLLSHGMRICHAAGLAVPWKLKILKIETVIFDIKKHTTQFEPACQSSLYD